MKPEKRKRKAEGDNRMVREGRLNQDARAVIWFAASAPAPTARNEREEEFLERLYGVIEAKGDTPHRAALQALREAAAGQENQKRFTAWMARTAAGHTVPTLADRFFELWIRNAGIKREPAAAALGELSSCEHAPTPPWRSGCSKSTTGKEPEFKRTTQPEYRR